jgi:hypothetical protein
MKAPHILLAGKNARRLKANLVGILDQAAMDAIEAAIISNVGDLYALGQYHFAFAARQNAVDWRQKISRLYYAAYSVSRCVRLAVNGDYSEEVEDHKDVANLPQDFPDLNTYKNRLRELRGDRNTCDYDHTAKSSSDLVFSVGDSLVLVENFIKTAKKYLTDRGVAI